MPEKQKTNALWVAKKQWIKTMKGQVSLSLKEYNDVFSVFDAREYRNCALSDDFLLECKKIVGESRFPVQQLKLWIQKNKRSLKDEIIIQKRLHSYFLAQADLWVQEKKIEKKVAQSMIAIGVLIGFVVSYIIYTGHLHPFLIAALSVVWEPASWFLIWTGADKAVALHKNQKLEWNHYLKLAHAKISFYNE